MHCQLHICALPFMIYVFETVQTSVCVICVTLCVHLKEVLACMFFCLVYLICDPHVSSVLCSCFTHTAVCIASAMPV